MGISKYVAVAVSGLTFAGGVVLAAAPAGAQAVVGSPQQLISGGEVRGGGPGPRPAPAMRRMVVRRPAMMRQRACFGCNESGFFKAAELSAHREHTLILNANRNFSESDPEQIQHEAQGPHGRQKRDW